MNENNTSEYNLTMFSLKNHIIVTLLLFKMCLVKQRWACIVDFLSSKIGLRSSSSSGSFSLSLFYYVEFFHLVSGREI